MTTKKEEIENKKVEETVTVPKSEWEGVLKTIEMLKSTADLGRVAKYEAKHKMHENSKGRVSVVGDKVVKAFRMVENFVGKLPSGVWVEKQTIELTLDDDTKVQMPYMEYAHIVKKPCEITARKLDTENDIEVLTIKLEDGKVYEINSEFFN